MPAIETKVYDVMLGEESLYDQFYEELKTYKLFRNRDKAKENEKIDIFYEEDNKLYNASDFVNRLIINYCDIFVKELNGIKKIIEKQLNVKNSSDVSRMAYDIANYINLDKYENTANKTKEKSAPKISIRLRKIAAKKIANLDINDDVSMSKIIKLMFITYLKLPKYAREKIIFSSEENKLNFFIRNDALFECKYINSKNENKSFYIYPLHIENSKDEMFNYLLCRIWRGEYNDDGTIKLGKITGLHLHGFDLDNSIEESKYIVNEKDKRFDIEKIRANGVQFGETQFKTYKVKFKNQDDFNQFKLLKRERPDFKYIGDYSCTLNCSEFQFKNYFFPFKDKYGEDIVELCNPDGIWEDKTKIKENNK